MGNQQYSNNKCIDDYDYDETIPLEADGGILVNRPRRSSIGIKSIGDTNSIVIIPNERNNTYKDNVIYNNKVDNNIYDDIIRTSSSSLLLDIDDQHHHHPSSSSSLLRSYGGIAALGDLVDKLWIRSINDPRLRMRLLTYNTIYHKENFAMVSQDIAINYGDGLPNNKDIANAIRSIINISTPLIINDKIITSPSCLMIKSTEDYHNNTLSTIDDSRDNNINNYTCCIKNSTSSISSSSTTTTTTTPVSSRSGGVMTDALSSLSSSSCCTIPILNLCLTQQPIIIQSNLEWINNSTTRTNQQEEELFINGVNTTNTTTTTYSLLSMLGGIDGITRLVNRTVEIIGADTRIRAYYIRQAISQSTSPSIRLLSSTSSSSSNNNNMSTSEDTTICVVGRIIPSLIDYLVAKISCYSIFDGSFNFKEMRTTISVSQAHRFLPLSDYHFDCVCQDFYTALNDCGINDNNIASQFGVILESCRSEVLEGHYNRKPSPWKNKKFNSISYDHISSPKDIYNTRAIATSTSDYDIIEDSNYYMDNQRTSGWVEVHSNGRIIQLNTARSIDRKEKIYSTTIDNGSSL